MNLDAITRVPGFQATGIACGLKQSGNKDIALIVADKPCTWTALFTTNAFQAAPVLYDRALLNRTNGQGLRAVLINAGNANACTGQQGQKDAEQMARYTEKQANLPLDSVFIMSTGVIGHLLPMSKIEIGINQAIKNLSPTGGALAAQAIMTTDTIPKAVFHTVTVGQNKISIGGIAKGSGMIHPNMATMLATLVTDANLTPTDLNTALRHAVNHSFNRITVDGDTSTNDTVVMLASGTAANAPLSATYLAEFTTCLTQVCTDLAKLIARDGEGATKLVEIQINGAKTETEAATAAATIATSPLSKTALFGNDPNWGRFLAAIGRSGATVDPAKTALWLQTPTTKVQLVQQGQPLPFDASALAKALKATDEVTIIANLGLGSAQATYWTCDLSYKYIEINAEYHT